MRSASVVRAVLGSELRQLLRDQRALVAAVLIPALLYPLVFLGQNALQDLSEKTLAAREVDVLLDVSRGQPEVVERFRAALAERTPITLADTDASALRELEEAHDGGADRATRTRELVQELFAGEAELLVMAETVPLGADHGTSTTGPEGTRFRLYYDIKSDRGREAVDRADACLDALRDELEADRRREILTVDPALGLEFDVVDVASKEDASGAALGRLLPLIAVLVLLSGGSYAALAVFAGERESGTLETLLVQPVPMRTIAWAKFLAVLITGLVTLACNLGSMLACVYMGLGSLPGLDPDAGGVGIGRLLAGIVYLPGAVLVSALLALVCGRARTFREGQATIFPVMIATLLPTSIALQPDLELDLLLAVVPLTGPALAFRDALRGQLATAPVLAMLASHALWCWLLLSRLASILDAEKVLTATDAKAALREGKLLSRRALQIGFASILVMYVVGGSLQVRDLFWGMTIQFWILIPAIVWAATRVMTRHSGTRPAEVLGLRAPNPLHALGALCLVPGLAWLALRFGAWQQEFLPMPRGTLDNPALVQAILDFPTWKLFFAMALSPALFEELLFRGVLLFGLRHDMPRWRSLLLQAALFAAAHASVYRLAPTFAIGLVLGALRLRTKSLWPAILLHAAYNGVLVLGASGRAENLSPDTWPSWLPWIFAPGLILLATRARHRTEADTN